ncbi:Proprotein convertase subtilisin/kexin type 6 precursor [Erwinia amylovora Ea644]|uniref:S8 family serine peptidase n=1 Tax=Erwinia amylovora TaxID=552 RepID=UPI0002CA3EF7|nr:S8 family serine peptidase [Erwinia amylovora]CCP03712.1 Proprotein convertase subtilisin/kexin type 6 precursor [Erwinia amylovora Ea644]
MKKKLLFTLMALCSANAAANVDFYAGEGIDYTAVVIKFSEKGMKSLNLNNAQPDSHKNIRLSNSYGMQLSMNKLFDDAPRSSRLGVNSNYNGLHRYFEIKLPESQKRNIHYINDIIDAIEKEHDVETVYPDSKPVSLDQYATETGVMGRFSAAGKPSSPAADATVPSFVALQYYMKSPDDKKAGYALGGINAFAAHETYPGSKGEGITVLSNEIDRWDPEHLDLPQPLFVFSPKPEKISAHDTMSVGIMAAKDNGFGVTGIANQASFAYSDSPIKEFIKGVQRLKPGDVVQLGIQLGTTDIAECSENCYIPMEGSQSWFDAIKTATDSGIHVIAAAGNGNLNLDHPSFKGKFDRKKRDSGSIIAGAMDAQTGKRAWYSDYGSAVSSASWGEDVVTTYANGRKADLWDAPNAQFTESFSGTSSANPIIAGAVAGLSGIAKQQGKTISPKEMRALLTKTGTPLNSPGKPVGTQPDMVRAAEELVGDDKPTQDLELSDLQAGPIVKESATLSFKVKAEGKLKLVAEVVNSKGVKKGSVKKQLNDNSATVKVSLSSVTPGEYVLRYTATNDQGMLIKQDSQKFSLSGAPSAPGWDKNKTYDKACTEVSWGGKVWLNGWWVKGTTPGSEGEWGAWRLKGAKNMHGGC